MPHSSSFTDVTREVHILKDIILSEVQYMGKTNQEEACEFNSHLFATKRWFFHISSPNKEHFLRALLQNIKSGWTLSLLLKSIWNCRPKDAVSSVTEHNAWSSYDQVPMDHDRAALPGKALVTAMKSDRDWFLTLEPENQTKVLTELLSVAGGPILWKILHKAQIIYERYRDDQLLNIRECMVIPELRIEKEDKSSMPSEKAKKDQTPRRKSTLAPLDSTQQTKQSGEAQRELEQHLTKWNSIIKSMKDSLKLEELEITFNDGSKRNIWKVNRPKPEAMETVDFIQLLPAAIGKRILSFLPRAQLGEYARVNKYWSYLVDDLKAEFTARLKIDMDIEKLKELVLAYDLSIGTINLSDTADLTSTSAPVSTTPSSKKQFIRSLKTSEKSAAYSLKEILKKKTSSATTLPPIRNLADMTEKLNRRGAVDDNLWQWCDTVLQRYKVQERESLPLFKTKYTEGVMALESTHFPCPLMKETIQLPLNPPLCKDPVKTSKAKPRCDNMSKVSDTNITRDASCTKKYCLWCKDFSRLYRAVKIPSYLSPV